MLIVSNFHDYYDGVSSLGVDKTCVYNRKTEKVDDTPKEHVFTFRDKRELPIDKTWRLNAVPYHRPFIIGFCGTFYLGYEFERKGDGETQWYFEYDLNKIYKKIKSFQGKNWYYKDHFENAVQLYRNMSSLYIHRQFNCPVFVLDYGTTEEVYGENNKPTLILNPCLKKYNFQTNKDAYTTHQEIYQFLSGVLGSKEKEIIEISEKDKIVQYGMCPRWSFRNPSPPRRKMK